MFLTLISSVCAVDKALNVTAFFAQSKFTVHFFQFDFGTLRLPDSLKPRFARHLAVHLSHVVNVFNIRILHKISFSILLHVYTRTQEINVYMYMYKKCIYYSKQY
jgi:hypothetical protein